ncbi:MAG: ATP-binding protein [Gemmatimonadota bacterium]
MSRQCNVLLVEDNPGDAKLVELMLDDLSNSSCRYRLTHARTLSEGVRAAEENPFHVVLLDLSLPDGMGVDNLTPIQAQVGDTPVILVTGRGSEKLAVQALKQGAADYLSKSDLSAEVLHRTISNALERTTYKRKLAELETFKANLIATTSHELRTPLAIIREYVALVRDGVPGPINDTQKDCLESALRNCDRLAALINDTLDLQRLDSGTTAIRRERTDLWSLVDSCTRDFALQAERKRQTLVVDLPADLPMVLADPQQIIQIMVNLLGNAGKFTPEGGRIRVTAESGLDAVSVSVEDTGVGIRPDDQNHIFEPFAQVDRRDAPGAQGTGLGLAIAARIAELHEGALSVSSALGQGATFTLTLPIHSARKELTALLHDHVQAAAQDGKRVGYVAVRLRREAMEKSPTLLDELHTAVAGTLRRRDDSVALSRDEALVLAVGETERPGSQGLLQRIEATVLEHLGRTLPVEFASGEVGPDDEISFALERLEFAPARHLPTRVLVLENVQGAGHGTSEVLATSELALAVTTATDVFDGMAALGRVRPDAVVVDASLPGCAPDQIIRRIRRHQPDCRVIVLAPRERVELPLEGSESLWLEPNSRSELLSALGNICEGRTWSAEEEGAQVVAH